ncbi:hypothetical protein I317_06298 [Kwoniella heveanensis CBS 569]|nr:hypothetical protein I317_06298 [Kwoniella heveanensis CBS 569]
MRSHPDLTYPLLPDAQEDLPLTPKSRSVNPGGLSLRPEDQHDGEFQWPEAGPSNSQVLDARGEERTQGAIGPFGAKAVAAMTGAMATSLLMTPFDVLKTRLQTVQPHPRSGTQSAPITPLRPPHIPSSVAASECCQTTLLSASSAVSNTPHGSNPLTCYSATASSIPSARAASASASEGISFASLRPAAAPASAPDGCLHPSKWAGIWGEALTFEQAIARGVVVEGGGASILALPQQVARVEQEVLRGFWSEVAAVRRETGVKGLWKGVGTAITMGIPSSAIYMLGYEHLLTLISPYFTGVTDPALNTSSLNRRPSTVPGGAPPSITASLTPAPLIAGSLARTLSATAISPIEMFRTRLQALPSVERGTPTYASTAKDMSKLVQAKGVTILWRGLGPTLWRDVPFSGIYWAGFELLKSLFTSSSSPLPPLSPISTSFLSGFISGTVSAIVTQPFDVLKTRRQVFNPSPGCQTTHAATIPLAMHVIRTEGWNALFAGLSARCGKVAPACGLMIACYEGVGRYLGGRQDE